MSYNELKEFITELKKLGCKTLKDAYSILYRKNTIAIQTQMIF